MLSMDPSQRSVEMQQDSACEIVQRLRDFVSADSITDSAADLEQWKIDGISPGCAVSPANAKEVADVLKLCSAKNWAVIPAGGFSLQSAGRRTSCVDLLLRSDRLNQVAFYDPGDL